MPSMNAMVLWLHRKCLAVLACGTKVGIGGPALEAPTAVKHTRGVRNGTLAEAEAAIDPGLRPGTSLPDPFGNTQGLRNAWTCKELKE